MKEKYNIIRSADRFIEQRQFKKAIKVYRSLLDSGEKDPSVVNDLGDLHARNGEHVSALKYYVQAAQEYSEAGDSMKAVGLCRKILRLDSGNDEILNLFLDLNQKRDAEFESRSTLEELVDSALGQGDASRAAELQEKLAEIDPADPSVELKLAEICFGADRKDSAAEAVYRAADLSSVGKEADEGWEEIEVILEKMAPSEDFLAFVKSLQGEYRKSSRTPVEEEPAVPPPPPEFKEDVLSPELFEVESSPEVSDSVETFEDSGRDVPLERQEEDLPEKGLEEESGEREFPVEKFAFEGDQASQQLEELETTEEFEIEIGSDVSAPGDQDVSEELPASREREKREPEAIVDEELPLVEEGDRNDYDSSSEDEEADGSFELDLDQVDISPEDLAALGISGLDTDLQKAEAGPGDGVRAKDPGTEEDAVDEAHAFDLEVEGETAEKIPEIVEGREESLAPEESFEIGEGPPEPSEDTAAQQQDEIEFALEGIFVKDEEAESSEVPILPEAVPEKEYRAEGRSSSANNGDAPPGDPDDDPEIQMELGVAYREMGLTEDALAKFENALARFEQEENFDKCVSCCLILAECSNVLEKHKEALGWVARGLDYRKVPDDEVVDFEYESAIALEALGDYTESLRGFRRIQSIQSDYKDVEKRITDMEASGH